MLLVEFSRKRVSKDQLRFVHVAIACACLVGCGNSTIPQDIRDAQKSISVQYTTIAIEDSGETVTAKYAIATPLEETVLRSTCETLVSQFIGMRSRRWIKIEFYLHESDPNLPFAGGWAEWDTNGNHADSLDGTLGDYTNHKLMVYPHWIPSEKQVVSRLPVEVRRKLFWDSTIEEDEHGLAGRDIFAQSRGLTADEYTLISIEGTRKSWPMPKEKSMDDEEYREHRKKVTRFSNEYFRQKESQNNEMHASKPHGNNMASNAPTTSKPNKATEEDLQEAMLSEEERVGVYEKYTELRISLGGRLTEQQRSQLKKFSKDYSDFPESELADMELAADGKVTLALQYATKLSKPKAKELMQTVLDKYPSTSAASVAVDWIKTNP